MPEILHVTPRARWEQAVAEGQYRGDTLAAEGFTHCCLSEQLAGVVSRYFPGQTGLVCPTHRPGQPEAAVEVGESSRI